MARIAKIESNLKKGCNHEIGEKTLVVGPNASGKSTITNAIELALTGRVSDIAGRADVGQEVSLMALAPHGTDVLWSKVTFDDGQTASYKTEGSTAKAKKATKKVPEFATHADIFPLRSMREAILGSAQTARKFLVSKGIKVTMDEVREMIPTHARKTFDQMVHAVGPTDTPADTLVLVLEKAGSKQRECAKEVSAFETVSNTYAGGIMAPPTNEELSRAERDWRNAVNHNAALRTKAQAQPVSSPVDYWQKQYDDMIAKQDYVIRELTEARAAKANLKIPELPIPNLDSALVTIKTSKDIGSCLTCGSEDIDSLTEREELINGALFQFQSAQDQAVRTDKWLTEAEAAANRYVSDLGSIEGQLERAKAAAANVEPAPTADEIAAAGSKADEMTKVYLDLKAQKEAWDASERARAGAARAKIEIEEWRELVDACKSAVDRLLHKGISDFIARVQSNLPAADRFHLALNAGEREVVNFGLLRGEGDDEYLHTALSGAEWARVTAAMASACVPSGAFAVIIPEERAFDPDTLRDVLEAFSASPHQIIVTSPIAPRKNVKGWTVIDRSA